MKVYYRRLLYVTANRNEELYLAFASKVVQPTELGRQQFFELESYGKRPNNPDSYCLCLEEGKKWFHVQQAETRKSFLTENWYGFHQYWLDWKGERWILRYLFAWHPNPPEWLLEE